MGVFDESVLCEAPVYFDDHSTIALVDPEGRASSCGPVDFDRRLTHDGRTPTDGCLGGRILLPILSRPLFANRMTLAVS